MSKKSGIMKAKSVMSHSKMSGGMISEDMSAVANMPKESFQKSYPARPVMMQYNTEDNITGIDSQMSKDVGQMKRHSSKNRY